MTEVQELRTAFQDALKEEREHIRGCTICSRNWRLGHILTACQTLEGLQQSRRRAHREWRQAIEEEELS